MTGTASDALQSSLAALDFTRVRYYAAQSTIFYPANEATHRAVELRADFILYRAVPSRSAREQRRRAAAHPADRECRARAGAGRPGKASPDVLTVAGYIRVQLARRVGASSTRRLRPRRRSIWVGRLQFTSSRSRRGIFGPSWRVPSPGRSRPITPIRRTISPAKFAGSAAGSGPLDEAARYDDSALSLDRGSTAAYLEMLDAHADLAVALTALGRRTAPKIGAKQDGLAPEAIAVIKAKQLRLEKARAVIAAWAAFDQALQTDRNLTGSPSAMAAFGLNDAPLAQALWLELHPDAETTAPRIVDEKDPVARARKWCPFGSPGPAGTSCRWKWRYREHRWLRRGQTLQGERSPDRVVRVDVLR